jgi:hypothetical protein
MLYEGTALSLWLPTNWQEMWQLSVLRNVVLQPSSHKSFFIIIYFYIYSFIMGQNKNCLTSGERVHLQELPVYLFNAVLIVIKVGTEMVLKVN